MPIANCQLPIADFRLPSKIKNQGIKQLQSSKHGWFHPNPKQRTAKKCDRIEYNTRRIGYKLVSGL